MEQRNFRAASPQNRQQQAPCRLWVDLPRRLISFHDMEDSRYKVMEFPSNGDKMAFVLQQCANGYRIQ